MIWSYSEDIQGLREHLAMLASDAGAHPETVSVSARLQDDGRELDGFRPSAQHKH
jgi:hypothetical protein